MEEYFRLARSTTAIASRLTRIGNHTGAIQGVGIRKSTSCVRREGGQRMISQRPA
jgi:hypothetical protein